ncbi:MAG: cytochrome c3 family protein [Deltaproteobacteria bacterium]
MAVVLMALFLIGANHSLAAPRHKSRKPAVDKDCVGCHPGPNTHAKVKGKDCSPCHMESGDNHLRNHGVSSMLHGKKFCAQCHELKEDKESVNSLHPGISAWSCEICHTPENYPLKKLPLEDQLAICNECHNRNQLVQAETRTGTKFRDGPKNLHYIHSEELYHIRCTNCHDIHSSRQLHLIRSNGSRYVLDVTIDYTANSYGGSCVTSCHKPRGYIRN